MLIKAYSSHVQFAVNVTGLREKVEQMSVILEFRKPTSLMVWSRKLWKFFSSSSILAIIDNDFPTVYLTRLSLMEINFRTWKLIKSARFTIMRWSETELDDVYFCNEPRAAKPHTGLTFFVFTVRVNSSFTRCAR